MEKPSNIVTKPNIAYGKDPQQEYDLYLPEKESFPLIVFFHGGGLESGDKASPANVGMAKQFVGNGYAFASVNYRRYTDGAKYPDFIEDCAQAVAQIKNGVKHDAFIIAGQSAGAWIALMLCVCPSFLERVGVRADSIAAWIINSAQTTSHFNVLKYEKGLDSRLQRIDEYAPLYYVNENLRFSPMFIDWYTNDMPCRAEQNELFVRAVKEFCPQVDIHTVCFAGTHCCASVVPDENGEYPFVFETLRWLSGIVSR